MKLDDWRKEFVRSQLESVRLELSINRSCCIHYEIACIWIRVFDLRSDEWVKPPYSLFFTSVLLSINIQKYYSVTDRVRSIVTRILSIGA